MSTAIATTGRPTGKAPQTAIASRSYDPFAPMGSANALKSLLDAQKAGIAAMLPNHISPERLFKTMLVACNRNPAILECTQSSIVETINRAAELGLDLSGTLGEAYPVPFKNKVKTPRGDQYLMQLQLIIGYRGLEKLAWQSGECESIDAEVVCQNDKFLFKKGTTILVEWEPKLDGPRGKPIGAYACVAIKGGGKLARFLTTEDIEKIRNSANSKNSPAWTKWWDEMARKCALKRTLKDAPLSTEKFVKALEHDDSDFEVTDVLSAETVPLTDGTKKFGFTPPKQLEAAAIESVAAQEEVQEQQEESQQEIPSNIDPETGEFIEEAPVQESQQEPEVKQEAPKQTAAAPAPVKQDPKPQLDQLPADADWDWMVKYAASKAPPEFKLEIQEVKMKVNLSLRKAWKDINKAERLAAFEAIRDGAFTWTPGKAGKA